MPLLVLHCCRLKGFADAPTIAGWSGSDERAVELTASHLMDQALLHLPGAGTLGWALTPTGRSENERLLGLELELVGARPDIQDAYGRFLGLNAELKAICTDWQVRGDTLNDHSDVDHDEAVIVRLVALHRKARVVCRDLDARLSRFGRYEGRLATARQKVLDGDGGWFTQPLIDSYHTVWFELHEDLLATLGIDRSAETSRR
jgi:hypothetical protein